MRGYLGLRKKPIVKTPPERGLRGIQAINPAAETEPAAVPVGFCQHGVACLLDDLRFRHIGHFGRIVGVLNTGLRFGQVGSGVVQVGDCGIQTVLNGTEGGAEFVDLADSVVKSCQRI